jgi:hypothetical protein
MRAGGRASMAGASTGSCAMRVHALHSLIACFDRILCECLLMSSLIFSDCMLSAG